jgi:two-component system nitrate/nitrite response regulator NarL
MTANIRLLIVEDHIIMREGLVSLLASQPDFEVIGEAGTVADAIELSRELKPDLILMDYGLPDGTGLDATRAILSENPEINIVFLTVHETDDDLFAAIRYGAKGYLLKNIAVGKMVEALRGMARGEAPLSRQMTGRVLHEFSRTRAPTDDEVESVYLLTPRELDVLAEICTGSSNKEIGDKLFISANTVKNHIHNILEKLGLTNRFELANYAAKRGLDKPSRAT